MLKLPETRKIATRSSESVRVAAMDIHSAEALYHACESCSDRFVHQSNRMRRDQRCCVQPENENAAKLFVLSTIDKLASGCLLLTCGSGSHTSVHQSNRMR